MSDSLVLRVVRAIASTDGTEVDIWWQRFGDRIVPIVTCNDTFAYATADAEEITAENVHLFEQAKADMHAVDEDGDWGLLFVARVRGLCPMPMLLNSPRSHRSKAEIALLEACGPPRCCNDCTRSEADGPCRMRLALSGGGEQG
jgi:hypothetical protein